MNKKTLLAILIASVDLKTLTDGLLDQALVPALQKVVDDSTNKFDDAAMALLLPILEPKLKEVIAAEIEKLKAQVAAL